MLAFGYSLDALRVALRKALHNVDGFLHPPFQDDGSEQITFRDNKCNGI